MSKLNTHLESEKAFVLYQKARRAPRNEEERKYWESVLRQSQA